MGLTFEEASEKYADAVEALHGGATAQPSQGLSEVDQQGRWSLRNLNGFLAFVTQGGRVLDGRLQPIGEQES